MQNLSIRNRLTSLIVFAALPALGLSIYNGVERRAQAQINALEDLQQLATLAARRQEEMIEGARQLLFAVAGTAELLRQEPRNCHEFFKRAVAASDGLYNSMGIHSAEGKLICNAVIWTGDVSVKDQRYFRLAADSGKFAVGDYQIDRATGLPGISFGYPVINSERKLVGVVFAGLDLNKLNALTAKMLLSQGGRLSLLDRNGIVLVEQPNDAGRVGQKARNARIKEALGAEKDQLFEAEDIQGVRRLFAVQRVGRNPDSSIPLYVVASIPRRIIFAAANAALVQTIAGIVIATALLVFGAWYGAEVFVLRRMRTLLTMASRIRAGDLTARSGMPPSDEELAQLGNALDDMAQVLQRRDIELKQALRELSEQVITDPLTGLHNRRYLWDFLRRDLLRARRAVLPVAAILFDIDHFKRFNDTWGHEAGDLVLKSAADVVKQNIRGSDIACRYGGEEFIVVLPETTLSVALDRAERIRRGVEQMDLTYAGKPLPSVTASFGIALFPSHAEDEEALVRTADQALYLAKQNGRNRVQVYDSAKRSLL